MTNQLPLIYYARHGETDWNHQGLIQGWTDTPLNATGHAQAKRMALFFADELKSSGQKFQCVVSPLLRAKQTMTYLTNAIGLDDASVSIDPLVKEIGFGVWEGKTFQNLKASPVFPTDAEARFNWRPQEGESYADGLVRIKKWLKTLQAPTVVVSHGAWGRCLLGYLTNMAVSEFVSLRMPQGKFCRIEQGRLTWFDGNSREA